MLQHGCLIHLRAFLRHALLPFSEELLPEVPNPQVADRDGGADDDDPRNAHPPRDDVDGLAGQVEEAHLEEEERAGDAPDDGVDEVEGRRQRPVHPRRGGLLGAPDPGERPDVLEEAGDLGEDEEDEERVGAVADEVAAGDEHEERGDVVGDEEGVPGEEGEVVEQVHGEVGDAVVEDVVLEAGVGRGEPPRLRRQREDGARRGERGGRAVREGDEAAGAVEAERPRPPPEQGELADAVDGGVHGQEPRVQPPLLGGQRIQHPHHRHGRTKIRADGARDPAAPGRSASDSGPTPRVRARRRRGDSIDAGRVSAAAAAAAEGWMAVEQCEGMDGRVDGGERKGGDFKAIGFGLFFFLFFFRYLFTWVLVWFFQIKFKLILG